jgi:hypothetical protein
MIIVVSSSANVQPYVGRQLRMRCLRGHDRFITPRLLPLYTIFVHL